MQVVSSTRSGRITWSEKVRKFIAILSENFMDDGQCIFHLQLARVTIGEERSNRLIMILLRDIPDNVFRTPTKTKETRMDCMDERQNDEQEQRLCFGKKEKEEEENLKLELREPVRGNTLFEDV